MPETTITQALAEIKTINNRIEKKRQGIGEYLIRDKRVVDPHVDAGGTTQWIVQERQAIRDLEERIVGIRRAIQESNLKTFIQVNGKERSVTCWLSWRKEVAPGLKRHLQGIANGISSARDKAASQKQTLTEVGGDGLIQVHLNETELRKEIESLEETLGVLDGELTLKNSTVMIEV